MFPQKSPTMCACISHSLSLNYIYILNFFLYQSLRMTLQLDEEMDGARDGDLCVFSTKISFSISKIAQSSKKVLRMAKKSSFSDTTCLLQLNFDRLQSFVKDIFTDRHLVCSEIHDRLRAPYVNFSFLNEILNLPTTSIIPSSRKSGEKKKKRLNIEKDRLS